MLFSCCSHLGSAVLLHYILTDLALFLQEQWHVIICMSGSKDHTQCGPFSLYPSLRYEYFFSSPVASSCGGQRGSLLTPALHLCSSVCCTPLVCNYNVLYGCTMLLQSVPQIDNIPVYRTLACFRYCSPCACPDQCCISQ